MGVSTLSVHSSAKQCYLCCVFPKQIKIFRSDVGAIATITTKIDIVCNHPNNLGPITAV